MDDVDAVLYVYSCKDYEMITSTLLLWLSCGLKVNLVNLKGMIVDPRVDAHRLSPVTSGDGFIDMVENFQYLGSCISRDGWLSRDV